MHIFAPPTIRTMKNLNLAMVIALATSFTAFSQKPTATVPPVRNCGTQVPDAAWDAWFNQQVEDYVQRNYTNRSGSNAVQITNYTIPMVVHVLHKTSEAVGSGMNISQAQVNSQLTVLNQDYSKQGQNLGNCPSTFTASIANTGIQFCLAKIDKNGATMSEPGIDRIDWQAKGWTDPSSFTSSSAVQSYFDGTIKPASIWDPTKYLNIWVADMSGSGLLGYATFPAGTSLTGLSGVETASTSGVVILTTAFGNTGNVAAPYNMGRTVTHEVGHWLGLRHIWGDGTCLTDYCNDTPPAQQANFGCPTFPHNQGVCSGNTTGEMTMNFMDYSDDACMYMFTNDQTTRIQTAMQTGTYRTQVAVSTVCNSPTTLDAGISSIIKPANGSSTCVNSVTPQVVLQNYGSVTITTCKINYQLDAGTASTYNWSGSLASSASATVTLPALTGLSAATHTYHVSTASPNNGSDQNTSNDAQSSVFTVTSSSGSALPFAEGFEGTTFVPTGWTYTPVNTTNDWSRVTTASGFGTSTACAKMDNYSGTTSSAGQKDDMITPGYNCTNANSTLRLKFDVAYAQYNTTVDSLNVFISTDCGSTWTKIYHKGGAGLATAGATTTAFTPTATQWRKDSVSLSTYAGQANVIFKFESVSGWGNNLYLDNINLNYTNSVTPPVANFSVSPSPACVGQTVSLTDNSTNSPTSWTWTMNGGSPASSTVQNPTVSYSVAGTYSITLVATNAGGSSSAVTKTITVNALPAVTATSNPQTICAGQSAVLTAGGASTYSWSTGANTATISVTPTVTTTYSVTGISAAGCGKSVSTTLTVNALPNVAATSVNLCAGSSATLTASGANTYTWNTGANTATISVTPTITTIYTVTGTSAAGCSKAATATVTINALPGVTANSATTCAGTAAVLTASGANTYNWSTGATTTSISVTPTVTTTYTVTGTSAAGCSKSITTTVTVNAAPNVTATSASVCLGNTATLTASGATTYTWNTGATSASIAVTPTGTTTYTVTGTNTGGCTKSFTTTVTVSPNPTLTVNDPAVCSGQSTVLTVSGASTYSWSTGSTSSSITVTPTSNTVYTVTGTNAAGCSKTTTATVTLVSPPTVSVNSATVCAGQQVVLTASGASTYAWSTGATSSSITVTPTSNATYTVNGANAPGCSQSVTSTVSVLASPTVAVSNVTICAGQTATLSASGATTYSWSTGATTASITVTPTNNSTYTVTGSNGTCTDSKTVNVQVKNSPNVSATSATVCAGQQATISASGATSYTWSTGANTSGASVTPNATTVYTVTGAGGNGCTATVTSTVIVNQLPSVTASSATICAGNQAVINAGGASTYSWNTGATAASLSVSPSNTTTYTVTGTDNSGCANSATGVVTVNAIPSTPTVSVNGNVLTSSAANGNQWYLNGTAINGATSQSYTATQTGTYNVVVTNSSGCSASSSTVTVNSTGIASMETIGLNLYPNPTEGSVSLVLTSAGTVKVEIINGIGQKIQEQSMMNCDGGCSKVFDLSNYPNGIYLFRIYTGEACYTKPVLLKQ